MFFEKGEQVQCSIGGMVGEFLDFGFDMETRTGTVTVKVGAKEVTWPTHFVRKVTNEVYSR